MKKIIILTGDELRHVYFRRILSNDTRFETLACFCEGQEKSLKTRTMANESSSPLEKQHVIAREQSEIDFFKRDIDKTPDLSNPIHIKKGDINNEDIVSKIISLDPDLLVCYGSSLIKSRLIEHFQNRFLNVHLGLSPYYRGSGTNIWPIINGEFDMIGATYMYIDQGIDTGKIIHQIRASIFIGDSPHSIGNRVIVEMTKTYSDLIANFDNISDEKQPETKGRLYKRKDFDASACEGLYKSLSHDKVGKYIENLGNCESRKPYIVQNKALQGKR